MIPSSRTPLSVLSGHLGDASQPQHHNEAPLRPRSNDSTQSIDNAYSLEHLFVALRRRLQRIVQSYNAANFHQALKVCARLFQSYASYNLNTIDEFARRLHKNPREGKQTLSTINQFRQQLSELRHCHSTFEAELLVTTLAINFHENDLETQSGLPVSTGKFSPRSRFSKFRLHQSRQAAELKSQLRQTNEDLQTLLFDEFNANLSHLWDESDKSVSSSVHFHDHHMTYILRLLPDIALKFEYALQICTKIFDLEAHVLDNDPQNYPAHANDTTPATTAMMMFTPYSDEHAHVRPLPHPRRSGQTKTDSLSALVSNDVTSASSISSANKRTGAGSSPTSSLHPDEHSDTIDLHDGTLVLNPSLFMSSERPIQTKDDRLKLQLLIEQLDKRLVDQQAYLARLLTCLEQTSKKADQLNSLPRDRTFPSGTSNEPAVADYQKALCSSDYQLHKSVEEELNVAVKETQNRIDWIHTVRTRAYECLNE